MQRKFEKWLILPDLQIPYEDSITLAAVEEYMKDIQASSEPFDGWLQIGDFLDFNELSRYNDGSEGSVVDELEDSYQAGNGFLDRHQGIMGKKCRYVLLEGNHDFRAYDQAKKNINKKFRGYLNYEKHLKLKQRKIKWVKSWQNGEMYKIGKAYFRHGLYTNQYHAKKMVERHGVNIFYGHTHDVMEIPVVQMGKDKTLAGKSLGCLCDYNQKYLRGAPTNWQQAFAVFYFEPDGYFNEYTTRIFTHSFRSKEGKYYDGNKIIRK
jgi:hypothetical protein